MEASVRTARAFVHEFSNCIGTIRTMTDLLAEEIPAGWEARADLDTLVAAVADGSRLLDAVREFVHPAPLGGGTADLNAAVRHAAAVMSASETPRVTLELGLHPAPVAVAADPERLGCVVLQLLQALAAGVAEGARLGVGSAPSDGAGELVVRVPAPGWDPADLPRVFEPFVADRGAEGLRLPTVYSIVTASGGAIEVEPAPGAPGAVFRVRLPPAPRAPGGTLGAA